jgi:hypothetical protein
VAAIVGIRWGDVAVGGSDYHCYAGQSRMCVEGRVSLAPPLPQPAPWRHAVSYLLFVPFTDWWYTRSMLPAIPA